MNFKNIARFKSLTLPLALLFKEKNFFNEFLIQNVGNLSEHLSSNLVQKLNWNYPKQLTGTIKREKWKLEITYT